MASNLPYNCGSCGASFWKLGNFERHRRTTKHKRNASVANFQSRPVNMATDFIDDQVDYSVIERDISSSGK